MKRPDNNYVGRFAPSPTGPLHFGSLVAALGSYLQAKHRQGLWLLRIDDLDHTRSRPQATDSILRTLDALGLHWDGEIMYQQPRIPDYQGALQQLTDSGKTFPCACTRKEAGSGIYSGHCRNGLPTGLKPRSQRLLALERTIIIPDALQGNYSQSLSVDVGDFVIHRADGIISYHLATILDDNEQHITQVVRGADLLDSTPRQHYIAELLDLPSPEYMHLPVATTKDGKKLSKQNHATPINTAQPVETLVAALRFLGQEIPENIEQNQTEPLLQWSVKQWDPDVLKGIKSITLDD